MEEKERLYFKEHFEHFLTGLLNTLLNENRSQTQLAIYNYEIRNYIDYLELQLQELDKYKAKEKELREYIDKTCFGKKASDCLEDDEYLIWEKFDSSKLLDILDRKE